MTLEIQSTNLEETYQAAAKLASQIKAPQIINLIGDLGAGKTAFTKGLAKALGCEDEVYSPSFTIMRKYNCANGLELHHYDFYRLSNAGMQQHELGESFSNADCITVIEWAEAVGIDVPESAISIQLTPTLDDGRLIVIGAPQDIVEAIK